MKADMIKKIELRLDRKLKILPNFIYDFIYSLDESQYRTKVEYAKDITLFFEFLLSESIITKRNIEDISLSDINSIRERDIRSFLSYLTEYEKEFTTPAGKTTKQIFSNSEQGKSRKLATLHKLFAYLYNNDLIDNNIASKVVVKTHTNRTIKKRLSKEQIELLLSTIIDDKNIESKKSLQFHQKVKFRDYIMVLILAYTGIRVSELTQLDINDVSIDTNGESLGSLKVIRKGGNKEEIILPELILEDIKDYLELRASLKIEDFHSKNALFISLQKKRINDRTIRNMLSKYSRRCGFDFDITPHTFRRTFGTEHYNKHGDMYLTALILGHMSAETTRKFYADPSENRKIKSMKQFEYTDLDTEKPIFTKEQIKFLSKTMNITETELTKKLE
ncbi:tyrosine-type recombinase/integrase [Clostridium perfringens]|uniref:tyrosine-type recombinase/integrase n=1 Tax=Clostridium perfringens TaxID=1502 RepID=UPI003D338A5B